MTDDLLDCDIIVVVAARGCERWVVLFDDAHREQAIQVVARWAESGICTWQPAVEYWWLCRKPPDGTVR